MKNTLLTLFAGITAGVLVMLVLVLQREPRIQTETSSTAALPEPVSELNDPASAAVPSPIDVTDAQEAVNNEVVTLEQPAITPSKMPTIYKDMIGPARNWGLSFAETHALFEEEPRDEKWALVMESGINNHVATYGADRGLVIEYVECRSRYCEVGGYAVEGFEADFSMVWGEMTRADWWQGGGSYQSQGGGPSEFQGRRVEGLRRFLAIIDRY